jgi:hypothetical protein
MLHRSSPPIIALTLLLALSAAPRSSAASLTDPILAQASSSPPTLKQPDHAAGNTVIKDNSFSSATAVPSEITDSSADSPDLISAADVASPEAGAESAVAAESAVNEENRNDNWLPWLLLPLIAGLGALLWWQKGRQKTNLRSSEEASASPATPSMAPTGQVAAGDRTAIGEPKPAAPTPPVEATLAEPPIAEAAPEVTPASEAIPAPETTPNVPVPAPQLPIAASAALGGAAVGATASGADQPESQIVLTQQSAEQAYVYWEVPDAARVAFKQQGGEIFALRIYDITDVERDRQDPHSVQSYPCSEADVDRHIPIPAGDRDYVAEIGYLTADQQWLSLAQSAPVRLSAPVAELSAPVAESPAAVEEPIESLLIESEPVAAESAVVEEVVEESVSPSGEPDPWFTDEANLGGIGAIEATFTPPSGQVGQQNLSFTSFAQSEVEAAKFDVGQFDLSGEDLASVDEGLPDLPSGYGESYITLMPRDPHWVYAYWDVPSEAKVRLRQQGGSRLALRFYDVTDVDLTQQNPHSLQQYYCEEFARDWYIPVPVSDRDYIVEIGYMADDGRWLLLAQSAPVRVPPVYPSDWYEEKFITVPWQEELQNRKFYELTPPHQRTSFDNPIYDRIFGLSESAEAQRVAGSLFGSMQQAAASSYITPSGMGLAAVTGSGIGMMSGVGMSGAGMYTTSGMGMSGIGMYSMSGLGMTSGIGMYTTSGMGMSGIGMYSMSGIGFSASMPPIRPRNFWLVADAELIVYGATEPDATVTIAGQTIKLNPDGTFRFQVMFADGQLEYPILAVAADGEQNRAIHLKFNRETPVRRTNTKEDAIDEWFQ